MCHILEGTDSAAESFVDGRGIKPVERLAVYANNAFENFHNSLRLSFPASARLGGDDYFRGCARRYQQRFPSRSGDLHHVGSHFPAFLGQLHASDAHRYFEDVARLEWLYQEALVADDHSLLDLSALSAVRAECHDELRFSLHPAVRLFESEFPAVSIWAANAADDRMPIINLDAGPERLAFTRVQGRVDWLLLTVGEHRFLAEVQSGATLGDAVGAALSLDPDFDPAAGLQRFVVSAVIVDFRLDSPRRRDGVPRGTARIRGGG